MNPLTTILIADDHPIFRKGLCEVIASDRAFRIVQETGDGAEALRLIQALRPALAILDIHMPKLTGLQVIRSLWEKRFPVKVIMLTMHEEEELFNEAMNLGVSAYVLKENAAADLLNAIRCVVDGKTFVSPSLAGLLLRRSHQSAALRREKAGLDLLTA